MKQQRNKWGRAALACALASTLLAGCSAAGEPEAPGASPADGGGPLEISFLSPLPDQAQDMTNRAWADFQSMFNVKMNVEWVPIGDYDTKLDLVLASNNLPDVVIAQTVNRTTVLKAFDNGAFWDLKPFLGDFSAYPNLKNNSAPDVFRYVTTSDGQIMGIPRNRPTINHGLFMRQDWLDTLGLETPTTMQEYGDAMVAMANDDPDGNGEKDTYGFVHPSGGTGIPLQFVAAFGGLNPQFTSDGNGLIHTNITQGYTDTVAWMRDLYARGAFMQEFTTVKRTQANELIETGKIGSYVENVFRAWPFENSMKKTDPNAELTIIAPQGPGGDPAVRLGLTSYGALYISKKVPEEKVKQILDFWERTNTEDGFNQLFFGTEGVHYDVVDGNRVKTEQGTNEIVQSLLHPVPLMYNDWWRAYNASAPKEYNDKVWEWVKDQPTTGDLNPFDYLISDTWTANYSKYESEWVTKVVEAIIGKITMEEYESYVAELTSKPEMVKAFQEFKEAYDAFWAN